MRWVLGCLILLAFSVKAAGQTDTAVHRGRWYVPDRAFWKSSLQDGKKIVTFPVRWTSGQWSAALITAGAGFLVMAQDETIQQNFSVQPSEAVDKAFTCLIEPFGSGIYTIPALAVMYGIGGLARDRKSQVVAWKSLEAFVYTSVVTQAIKQLTHRHRPYQDDPPDAGRWDGPIAPLSYDAFPSGHSSAAFAVATVIGVAYRKTVWVPLVTYSLASLVAIERLIHNEHWASDVLFGSAIGIGIGLTVVGNGTGDFTLIPVAPGGAGLTISYRIR